VSRLELSHHMVVDWCCSVKNYFEHIRKAAEAKECVAKAIFSLSPAASQSHTARQARFRSKCELTNKNAAKKNHFPARFWGDSYRHIWADKRPKSRRIGRAKDHKDSEVSPNTLATRGSYFYGRRRKARQSFRERDARGLHMSLADALLFSLLWSGGGQRPPTARSRFVAALGKAKFPAAATKRRPRVSQLSTRWKGTAQRPPKFARQRSAWKSLGPNP
jgi:hypothetical protein